MATENPPWVDRVLNDNWSAMDGLVGSKLMPRGKGVEHTTTSPYAELGTGHYGAVFDTGDPGLVLKITSDPAEARFILSALSIGKWPDGIVRYHEIMRLPATFRGRSIYAIWREKAFSTGDILPEAKRKPNDPYYRDARAEFGGLLYTFLLFAAQIRQRSRRVSREKFLREVAEAEDMDVWEEAMYRFQQMFDLYKRGFLRHQGWEETPKFPYRGKMRVAVALSVCQMAAEFMENSYGAVEVGGALSFYLQHGVLLADVHTENVGQVRREENEPTVITDPGHAVFLTDRFDPLFRRAQVDITVSGTQIVAGSRQKKRRKKRNPAWVRLMGI